MSKDRLHLPFRPIPAVGPDAVEFRDSSGSSLLVAQKMSAPRLNLVWRCVALIVLAPGGRQGRRVLFRRRGPDSPLAPGLWDLPASGALHAGEAVEDAALRLAAGLGLRRVTGLAGEPVLLPLLSVASVLKPGETAAIFPPARFGRVELTLLRGYLPAAAAPREIDLWLDPEECQGFLDAFADTLSPLLLSAVERGVLWGRPPSAQER